jgi:hypothetical protein
VRMFSLLNRLGILIILLITVDTNIWEAMIPRYRRSIGHQRKPPTPMQGRRAGAREDLIGMTVCSIQIK